MGIARLNYLNNGVKAEKMVCQMERLFSACNFTAKSHNLCLVESGIC